MYKYILIILLCTLRGFIFSKEIHVICEKSSFINQKFKIDVVSDYITQHKKTIYADKSNEKGGFDFSVDLQEVKMMFIDFGKAKRTFFVEPGKSYTVFLPPLNPRLLKEEGYLAKDVQALRLKETDTTELNFLMDKVERKCNEFIEKNKQKIYYNEGVVLITEFISDLQKLYIYSNSYFQNYLKYTIGTFEAVLMKNHPEKIRKKYFSVETIDLNNIQYVGLLQNTYRGYIKYELASERKIDFIYLLNAKKYKQVLQCISSENPYDEELSNLILVNGILELQNNSLYNKKSMGALLDSVIKSSKNKEIKHCAVNVKNILFHLQPGTEAPEIFLSSGSTDFKLSEHQGKYVYLSFFKSYDKGYEAELKLLNNLQSRYAKNLEIISISTDYDQKQFEAFIKNNTFNWSVLHYQKNEEVLLNYRIEDARIENYERNQLTQWILISPEGKIVYYPAKSPSQGFENMLKRLIEG